MKKLLLVMLLLHIAFSHVSAEPNVFKSGSDQTGVLELYTSEGCSSCPPADRWLSELTDKEGLWHEFIPMAFHVDYWDYIGWKDQFASPAYSNRQRLYAFQQSLKTVYTPGFIYNGEEWRNWRLKRFIGFPDGGMPGVLEVSISDNLVEYKFSPEGSLSSDLLFNIALLGFDIKSAIKNGENAGRELNHDFVVLNLKKTAIKHKNGIYTGKAKLPKPDIKAPKYGIAAWVNKQDDLSPIQAVGGYLY